MTQTDSRPTGGQKLYLFLLRAMGWLGLLVMLVFAFGWSMGALRADEPPLFALALSIPGVLVSVFLTGTPDRPGYLLRPTSFLKAFFVCGFFIGLASSAILVQSIALMVVIDIPLLFAALGLPILDQQLTTAALKSLGPDEVAQFYLLPGLEVGVAYLLAFPGLILANLASLVCWFIRFPPTVAPPSPRANAPRAPAYDEEKARALRAMRIRMNARNAG